MELFVSSDCLPIKFFCGAGGIILPRRKYFSTNRSYKPRKSLNRRRTLNSFRFKAGMLERVVTLYCMKKTSSKLHIYMEQLVSIFLQTHLYAMYEPIPSPTLCGSDTVISLNWSLICSVATSSIVDDRESD